MQGGEAKQKAELGKRKQEERGHGRERKQVARKKEQMRLHQQTHAVFR